MKKKEKILELGRHLDLANSTITELSEEIDHLKKRMAYSISITTHEQVIEKLKEQLKDPCLHRNIRIITESTTFSDFIHSALQYVKCADCGEILPIKTITQEII